MAHDKDYIQLAYPLPVYNYRVTILEESESPVLSFSEVSGLNVAYEPVTYKHGLSFLMGPKIIPGMPQEIRLTMKRGIIKNNNENYLYSWIYNAYNYADPFYTNSKRDVLIDLCNESGQSVIRWTVQGALPIKLEAPTYDASSNDVAIETMEFIAQGLKVDYNP